MTNTEADNLIASLPQPGSLRLFREGDRIVMDGGKTGSHSLDTAASNGSRLLAHWKGYVENNGLSLGPDYGRVEKPRPASELRDLAPGDKVTFFSASYSSAGGYRPGVVVRATPKRVLVEFVYKKELEKARRQGREPIKSQMWRKRKEVRRVTSYGGRG